MAIINQASKELQVKVVYYGPAVCGKTTNLVQIHDHVQTAQGNKGKLVSLATSSDRTLFFVLNPLMAIASMGRKSKKSVRSELVARLTSFPLLPCAVCT